MASRIMNETQPTQIQKKTPSFLRARNSALDVSRTAVGDAAGQKEHAPGAVRSRWRMRRGQARAILGSRTV